MPPRPYNLVPRWPGPPGCHIVGKSAGEAQVRWGVWTAARRHRSVAGVEQGDQVGGGRGGGPVGARLGDAAAAAGELPHPRAGGAGAGGAGRGGHPVERPAGPGAARALGALAGLAGPHDGGEGEPGLGAAGALPRGGARPRPGQATRRLTMSGLAVTVLSVVMFAAGAALVAAITLSAVETLVGPRGTPIRRPPWGFRSVRVVFNLRSTRATGYDAMDRAMALYAPISLLILVVAWLVIIGAGYVLMFFALGVRPLRQTFILSGSSLFTLGFAVPKDLPTTALAFSEATFGIGMIALLLSYLPSMYTSFSRREAAVAGLDVRAGSPPSAAELLIRHSRIEGLDHLDDLWRAWETSAGGVLDAASLTASTIDRPRPVEAQLCIRAGYIALRKIADFFGIPFHPDPHWPDQPISIDKSEFEEVYDQLRQEGVPVKPDREQAWRDFAGWRG